MSVAKFFLERVEGLLDEKVLAQLRQQVAEAKGPVTAETLAKILVDAGHLTTFQAKKIVGEVTEAVEAAKAKAKADKTPQKVEEELGLADLDEVEGGLELIEEPPPKPAPTKTTAKPTSKPAQPAAVDGLELLEDSGLELIEDTPPPKQTPKSTPAKQQPAAPQKQAPAKSSPAAQKPAATPSKQQPAKPTGSAPAKSSASASAAKPKSAPAPTPAKSTSPSEALVDTGGGLELIDSGLSPLDEVLGDPLADPLMSASSGAKTNPLAAPKKTAKQKNPWDSALIYVGGGGLLVLALAAIVLYLTLMRGNADEAFKLAEEDFAAGAYPTAIEKYESFVNKYKSNQNASLAKVRIGLAKIRMATSSGKNWGEALNVTRDALKEIEQEERFDEARAELADTLPRIADALAQEAKRAAGDAEKAGKLVAQAEDALKLVNNGAYIPASLRAPVEAKVTGTVETVAGVKRDLSRDAELKAAIATMTDLTNAGKTNEASDARRAFLRKYPGLDLNPELVAATLAVAAKEKTLVKVAAETLSPVAEAASAVKEIALVDTSGEAAAGSTSIVTLTVGGSVYGFDAASGKLVWRRFVGLESLAQPLPVSNSPGADVLVVDRRQHHLLRVKVADGSTAWQLPLGEPFFGPTIVQDNLIVTTESGKLIEVDAATGESKRRVILPQGASQSAAFDPRRPYLYQLGTHSHLFVIATNTLECQEIVFTGHSPGGITAPPVATGGQIFISNNAGADFSFVEMLSADSEGLNLAKKRDRLRLRGRIVTAPIIDGKRVYVFTDLGAAQVFDVDPANVNEPVADLTKLVGTRKEPLISYAAVVEGRLWLGDERVTLYELQPARKELTRRWSKFEGETILVPPQVAGDLLISARLRRGSGDVAVAAVGASDGAARWTTSVGVPVRLLTAGEGSVMAANASGSAFALSAADAKIATAAARLGIATDPPRYDRASIAGNRVMLSPTTGDAQWGLVATGATPQVAQVKWAGETAKLVAPALPYDNGLLLPLGNGQVTHADLATGKQVLLPFQPRLDPGPPPLWHPPIVVRGSTPMFAIANDRGRLFLAGRKDQPQPHLALLKEVDAGGKVLPQLAQVDDKILAAVEKDGQYLLASYQLPDLTPGEPVTLSSGVAFGPLATDAGVLLVTDADGLLCLDAELKTKWKTPLDGAGVVATSAVASDLLVVTSRGALVRIDAAGKVVKRLETNRPLGGEPLLVGQDLWCPGADGAVYVVPLTELAE